MTTESNIARQYQYALFDEDFDVSPGDRAFVDAYLANGGNGTDAMRTARPHLTPRSAKSGASRKLAEANDPKSELHRYLLWKQAKLVMESNLTAGELIGKTRRVYLHAVGDLPLRKSLVTRDEEGGVSIADIEIREPSLSAANTAIETLRKIGGFGVERSEVRLDGDLAIAGLSEAEREARLAELARKAGLIVPEGTSS